MSDKEKRIRTFEETMRICKEEESLQDAVYASAAGQYIIWQENRPNFRAFAPLGEIH